MKQIDVVCLERGTATVTTSDVHIDNESLASKIVIDFSAITGHTDTNKWVDLVFQKDGTSLRYDLGVGDIVELELEYETTIAGVMTITPIIYDGLATKLKFKTNSNIVIYKQLESGTLEAILRDDFIFELSERVAALEEEIDMDVNIIGSIPLDVTLQDQTSPAIIAKFKKEITRTVSTTAVVINENNIIVSVATGFAIGKYVTVLDAENNKFYLGTIVAVLGTTITLDSPFDYVFPIGSVVAVSNTNMAVDGSSLTQIFNVRDDAASIDVQFDVTRVMIAGLTASAPNLAKFGDLDKLIYGIVLRRTDGTTKNIFNAKSNSELANIMYDFSIQTAANANQGQNGFTGRLTFAGQNKIGVAIRLGKNDNLELLVQDNLVGLTSLEFIAEGHLVVD